MISPYLCTDSHRDNSISLGPVYGAKTRPIGEIGCDDGISSLHTVDAFTIGRSNADTPAGVTMSPPLRSEELRFKVGYVTTIAISPFRFGLGDLGRCKMEKQLNYATYEPGGNV